MEAAKESLKESRFGSEREVELEEPEMKGNLQAEFEEERSKLEGLSKKGMKEQADLFGDDDDDDDHEARH